MRQTERKTTWITQDNVISLSQPGQPNEPRLVGGRPAEENEEWKPLRLSSLERNSKSDGITMPAWVGWAVPAVSRRLHSNTYYLEACSRLRRVGSCLAVPPVSEWEGNAIRSVELSCMGETTPDNLNAFRVNYLQTATEPAEISLQASCSHASDIGNLDFSCPRLGLTNYSHFPTNYSHFHLLQRNFLEGVSVFLCTICVWWGSNNVHEKRCV